VLFRLLKSPNAWVSYPQLEDYTRNNCTSRCTQINTRVCELRNNYHFNIENHKEYVNGIWESDYKIHITHAELSMVRAYWMQWKKIPDFRDIKEQLTPKVEKPVQGDMFASVLKP
jgi:hypothetical protein